MLKIKLHHIGYFASDHEPAYVIGELFEIKGSFDIYKTLIIELDKVIKELGY